MEENKIDLWKEHLKNAFKIDPKQAAKTLFSIVLKCLPLGDISSELWSYHSNIKQDRINKFAEVFQRKYEEASGNLFNPDNIQTEVFLDSFEAIIRKVASTRHEHKIDAYANILLKQLYTPDKTELVDKYIGMVDEISSTQVLLLSFIPEEGIQAFKLYDLVKDKTNAPQEELAFYFQDLNAKGLIKQAPQFGGVIPPGTYDITAIGRGFLKFIKNQ